MKAFLTAVVTGVALLQPAWVHAHSFGVVYNLPVPVSLYLWGAALALALSFVVLGLFLRGGASDSEPPFRELQRSRLIRLLASSRLIRLFQLASVAVLVLCIHTGLTGTSNAYRNFSMTWFWIVFVLGFAYFVALFGDAYRRLNPWKLISDVIGRVWGRYRTGLLAYPAWLAYWPALALYMTFIAVELFVGVSPRQLGQLLLVYTAINIVAAGLFGTRDWFRYGEFFAVFLRLLGHMGVFFRRSVHHRVSDGGGEETAGSSAHGEPAVPALQWPFSGLLRGRAESVSLLLFILFMLSSTAFDGIRETVPWMRMFWIKLFPYLEPWVGSNPIQAFAPMRELFVWYNLIALILSPFAYLLVYLVFITLAKFAGGSELSIRELALRFAYSLLPIALVYHVTHYYTLLQTQGIKIIALISDPWGRGDDFLGTATWFRGSVIPDAINVWHTQVGLIVFGHIVSVWIAHEEALRTFPGRKQALLSQVPMLVLMMLFTAAGLWILSQPISPSQ